MLTCMDDMHTTACYLFDPEMASQQIMGWSSGDKTLLPENDSFQKAFRDQTKCIDKILIKKK